VKIKNGESPLQGVIVLVPLSSVADVQTKRVLPQFMTK
jgi:hypothetical protein